MKNIILLALSIFIFTLGTVAQDSKWKVRFRMVSVDPTDSSTTLAGTEDTQGEATYVDVDSDFIPEVDVTYMFTKNWGLEVIAGTSNHSIIAVEGLLSGAKVGDIALLPPTFTAQYFFNPDSEVQFYLGAGLNYTLFYDYSITPDIEGLGVTDLEFSNSFGWALNTGIDGYISDQWLINVDIKYVSIDTTVDLMAGDTVANTVDVDINPWLVSLGVGYKF